MNNRLNMLWLSSLTVYMAYTTTDTYAVLKSVQQCQVHTLHYMEKSAAILKRLKHLKHIEKKA